MLGRLLRAALPLALILGGAASAQTPSTLTGPRPTTWELGGGPTGPLHGITPILMGRPAAELPLARLKVPPGFKVAVWADGVTNARSLALGAKGTVFVGNLAGHDVFAITEAGGKRRVRVLLKGLDAPNGVAFADGALFVAERTRISRYDAIEDHLDDPPAPKLLAELPENKPSHYWHYLALGPDGKLYFNIGTPQNITMPDYMQAAILRIDPRTGIMETYATGVRNSVGMAFHPVTHQLWFTDNGRDWLAEDLPEDKLNVATRKGENFGYPFCHEGDLLDPVYGKNRSCAEFVPPVAKLGAHVAPLGLHFYTGHMFPAAYRNNLFIARHGSWNRSKKQGYDVVRAIIGPNDKVRIEPFLTGFLVDPSKDPPMWGRPVDLLVMPDGALLVSDDYNGVIYRISYGK